MSHLITIKRFRTKFHPNFLTAEFEKYVRFIAVHCGYVINWTETKVTKFELISVLSLFLPIIRLSFSGFHRFRFKMQIFIWQSVNLNEISFCLSAEDVNCGCLWWWRLKASHGFVDFLQVFSTILMSKLNLLSIIMTSSTLWRSSKCTWSLVSWV